MPMLLEDLAEETSASNGRAADRLDAEARALDDRLRRAEAGLDDVRQDAVASAGQATEFALARVPLVEGVWRGGLAALRKTPTGPAADRLLNALLVVFQSAQRLVRATRGLSAVAEQLGAAPERADELSRAEARFEELAAEVRRAREHRAGAWQPADPDRLNGGLQLAREGRTVKADEARARFRRDPV